MCGAGAGWLVCGRVVGVRAGAGSFLRGAAVRGAGAGRSCAGGAGRGVRRLLRGNVGGCL